MPKTKITLPEHFTFITEIPIRITDLNYGGHVGNDSVLSILHEIRMQFLRHHEYTEFDLAGTSMIMADVAIEFRNEVFYGESIKASVAAGEFSRVGFDVYYKLEKQSDGKWVTVALARTGMVCYNYSMKKIVSVPKEVCTRLLS